MLRDIQIVETDRPSFKVLKWIGAGGFGNVFKVFRNNEIVACKQIQTNNLDLALKEIGHMTLVREGPHIAAVHDGLEWNTRTRTLSLFMDYYKGKDLDRQVQMLKATGERFTESQVIDIAYQIAVALEHCHSQNVLHQDIKPMNVLLGTPWDPATQETVPNLYLADFRIASHVQTLGSRLTSYRGTQGYKAPELLGQDPTAFSQKSDIYALGCMFFYLLTLNPPGLIITDLEFDQISLHYSQDLICIVSAMLSSDRTFRPTATEVREYLTAHIHTNISSTAKECRKCRRIIFTGNQYKKHTKSCIVNLSYTDADRPITAKEMRWFDSIPGFWSDDEPSASNSGGNRGQNGQVDVSREPNTQIKNSSTQAQLPLVHLPSQSTRTVSWMDEQADPAPCAACLKRFSSKRKLMNHLYCGHHVRKPKYVQKRLYEYTAAIEEPQEPMLLLEDIPDRIFGNLIDSNIKTSQSPSLKRSADDDGQPHRFKRPKTQTQTDLPPPIPVQQSPQASDIGA